MELLIVAFNMAMALLIAGARMGQDADGRFDEDAETRRDVIRKGGCGG